MDQASAKPLFLYCLRCHGHGHFVLPGRGKQFEVFSQEDALHQLDRLAFQYRLSRETRWHLGHQVGESFLPWSCPEDVKERVNQFCKTDYWEYFCAMFHEGPPEPIEVDSEELALAVHEFLLESRGGVLGLH
jgi:hypothetical protein